MIYERLYKEFIRAYGGISGAQREAKSQLNSKYLGSTTFSVSHGELLPGVFYVFNHTLRIDPMTLQSKGMRYLDTQPIVLGLGKDYKTGKEEALNLNAIPSKVKLAIIQRFWEKFDKVIEANSQNPDLNSWQKISSVNKDNVEDMMGLNLSLAINKFDFGNIKNLRVIDYYDTLLLIHHFNRKMIFKNNYGHGALLEDFMQKMTK
jgi:hypothetical protein